VCEGHTHTHAAIIISYIIMLKIAINASETASFALSSEAARRYLERKGIPLDAKRLHAAANRPRRDDPILIDIIEQMGGAAASASGARIVIVVVPADEVPHEHGWRIDAVGEGGYEQIYTRARVWGEHGLVSDLGEAGVEECDALFR
jgi:hypothetical protein